ncbi:NAD-dependent succinate-semialdehyde dehydrogenase [Robertkochia aurantiaca]|uniref:NAD-dependent succinate-semialdehyde dehydrogenase n=1 Tax=Robertkochia aurantiaca TaxID=2873700 RepID=UPI001CCA6909|nr:NAD-dependent succinate-semialdehyde dehydrogenase [Robertkochia sp. 3YJGBD-33]
MIKSVNPYNGKELYEFEEFSSGQIAAAVDQAHKAHLEWRNSSFDHRRKHLKRVAELLREGKENYARTMSVEMGKPITQAIAEVEKCAWVCDYYADHAQTFLASELKETDAGESYVSYEPLGVVLAVMPWNYPYWQVFRFAAPAVMAGNTGLLKHASNVMKCAQNIEKIFLDAGFPEGVFSQLPIGSKKVKEVIENDKVRAVTLTGSEPAGRSVAADAGNQIKKTVLELGGSNAFIVMKDADIEKAAETALQARFQNTGQSCIAAKRLLLHEDIAEAFIDKFKKGMLKMKSGDPLEEDTYIGVMAREDLAEELEDQLKRTLDMGAELILGGKREKAWFEPTLVDKVTPEMPLFREETFGPVIGVTRFSTADEAINLSNDSKFGLGVNIFTNDIQQIKKMVPRFEEGAVFINEMVKSDPRLPFGGVKASGYGRELSEHGIREFVNIKTVYINY